MKNILNLSRMLVNAINQKLRTKNITEHQKQVLQEFLFDVWLGIENVRSVMKNE